MLLSWFWSHHCCLGSYIFWSSKPVVQALHCAELSRIVVKATMVVIDQPIVFITDGAFAHATILYRLAVTSIVISQVYLPSAWTLPKLEHLLKER